MSLDCTSQPHVLTDLVTYQQGSVVSKTLVAKAAGTVTVFAFDAGQGLSEHTAPYDALVQIIDGEVDITVAERTHRATQGQVLVMPANVPHALRATTPFKMMLTMIKS